MIGSKNSPREMKLDAGRDVECDRIYVAIQNESLNIDDLMQAILRDSDKLSRLSNDNQFRGIVSGFAITVISLVRLLAVVGPRPRRLRPQQVEQAMREMRRILGGVKTILKFATSFRNVNSKMETLVRNIEFLINQLKKRQARMAGLLNQQKALGCLG